MSDETNNMLAVQMADVLGVEPEVIKKMVSRLSGAALSVDNGFISGDQYEAFGDQELRNPIANKQSVKLYKYYSDKESSEAGINYSRQSLRDGTVHLSTPNVFNDPFDCLINIDAEKVTAAFLMEFARRFNIGLDDGLDSNSIASVIADQLNDRGEEELPHVASFRSDGFAVTCQLLYLSLLFNARQLGGFNAEAIRAAVRQEVEETKASIRGCRVACFTSNASNLHMWAHYANEHQGFCVEYYVPEKPALVWSQLDEQQRKLLCNIFGVYYSPTRQDCTDLFTKIMLGTADESAVGNLYSKVLCSKGVEWVWEQEYRLIVQDRNAPSTIPFFPAKTIFLGARMPERSRREIIDMLAGTRTNVVQMRLSGERYGLDGEAIVTYGPTAV